MVRADHPHIIEPALIVQAAASFLGAPPIALLRVKQNRSRVIYELASRDGGRVFLKAEVPGERPSLAVEAWALNHADGLGIPVPKVMALDCSETRFPFRWLLLSEVAGVHLTDARLHSEAEAEVLRRCSAFLVRLHSVATTGFGPLDDDLFRQTGAVSGTHRDWRDFLIDAARTDAGTLARQGLLSTDEADRCVAHIASRLPDAGQGHLIHGDFDRNHVFVDPATGDLTGIIDFGARESADAEWELSWPSIFDTENAAAAIVQGYRQAGGAVNDDILRCYILVRLLWLTRWRFQRGELAGSQAACERLLSTLG